MANKKTEVPDVGSLRYGEARARLEEILEHLEGNEVDIDDLSDRVKEAAALIKVLHDKLTRTQGEIESVLRQVQDPAGEGAAADDAKA